MNYSEAEIAFACYGGELTGYVLPILSELASSGLEGGKMSTHYAISQQGRAGTFSARFKASGNNVEESIEVTFGHTTDWKPVVLVGSSKTEPKPIPSVGDANADARAIATEVRRCFRLIVDGI